jgi:hypothetical protein
LNYTFSEDVSASLMAGDITLLNRTTNTTIPAASIRVGYAGNVVMFICSDTAGHYLADGDYRATIVAGGITDVAGNPLPVGTAFDFFVLAADADHNRTVDFNDLVPLAQNYNTSGKTFAQGDYNYDGGVDFNDLVLLAQRYNTTLAAPPVAAPLVVAVSPDIASAIAVTSPGSEDKGSRKGVFSDVPVKKPVSPKPKAPARPVHR